MIATSIEVSDVERNLLKKSLEAYLSELRVAIVATKHDRGELHQEEDIVKGLLEKLS